MGNTESEKDVSFVVEKDFGAFGEGSWQKHLTLTSWNGNPAKYDIRPWNKDMTRCGKGLTFTDAELLDLGDIITEALLGEN